MSGYLLDTNIVSYLYNPERVHHGLVDGVLASFDKELPQVVSSITLAELRFGLRMTEEIGNDTESFARGIHKTEAHKILEAQLRERQGRYRDAQGQIRETVATVHRGLGRQGHR